MLFYMIKRLGLALLVALTVSILAYLLVFLSGDPALALAGEGARQADIEMVRKAYGLDRPLVVQYASWLWKLLHGQLGMSVYFKTEVGPLVFDKLKTTLLLGVYSLVVALLISVHWVCWPRFTRTAGSTACAWRWRCWARPCRISFLRCC